MSASSDDNQDLQTYLDSLNKEVEEGSESLVELSSEVVASPYEIVTKDEDDIEEENATYYVDEAGNYYLQQSEDDEILEKEAVPNKTEKDGGMEIIVVLNNEDEDEYKESKPSKENTDGSGQKVYDFQEHAEEAQVTGEVAKDKKTAVGKKAPRTGGQFACIYCSYTVDKRYMLSRHLKLHSDDRPYKCRVCERGFKTNVALVNHLNTHLGRKPHACKSCDKRFTTSGELTRHVRYRHTGDKPHKCTECDYSSVELSKLRRHIRCHTGERPYQCPHCTYASPDTFKLKRHLRTHTGEKPYECEICNARFTQSNSLKAHRLIHSVGDKPIFQCTLCPTTCGRKTDLRLHIQKLHHSDKPIICKRCFKELPDRYSYKVHIKTHEGEKCFRCAICPYASISQRHLESHMLLHTDQKPFVCDICSVAFRQMQLLKRHLNLYHNKDYVRPAPREKMHSCPHCRRRFNRKGNLMRHMESHDSSAKAERTKLALRMGRLKRINPEALAAGNISISNTETNGEENMEDCKDIIDEEYELIETIEEYQLEEKPTVSRRVKEPKKKKNAAYRTVTIKKENTEKGYMALEVDDDQEQFMVVEVIQCDEDEEDEENCVTVDASGLTELEFTNSKKYRTEVDNCFGFSEEETEDPLSNKTIEFVDVLEEE